MTLEGRFFSTPRTTKHMTKRIATSYRNRFIIMTADGRFAGGSSSHENATKRIKTWSNNPRKYGAPLAVGCTVIDTRHNPDYDLFVK